VRWRHGITSLNFSALTGDADRREIVISDFGPEGEAAVWLNLRTGEERARSGILAETPAPGNILTPGFGGASTTYPQAGNCGSCGPGA